VAAAGLCALLALALPGEVPRLAFAAPLALFLPGYAIVAVTFARRPLQRAPRLLLSLGLSLAVLALGPLALNYLPGGVSSGWWAALLFLIVLGASRAAALRRPPPRPTGGSWRPPSPSRSEAFLHTTGAVAAIAALVLAFVPLSARDASGYAELWIEPVHRAGTAAVRVGVANREQAADDYYLEMRFGQGRREVARVFSLEAGQSSVMVLPSPLTPRGEPLRVVASLYRQVQEEPRRPYRRVWTWIPPLEEPQ
jgi:uncharacterized membrane protein